MVVYPRYLGGQLVGAGESYILFIGFFCICIQILYTLATICQINYSKNANNIGTIYD